MSPPRDDYYGSGTIALTEPPPPRRTTRPPGALYQLEDRLPGVRGTFAPPPPLSLRAFAPVRAQPERSSRALWLAGVLVALSVLTGAVVYRDMARAPAPPLLAE